MNPIRMLLDKLVPVSIKLQGLKIYRIVGRRVYPVVTVRSVNQEEACLALSTLFQIDSGYRVRPHAVPFVAYQSNHPVGFVELIRPSDYTENDSCYWLYSLYVRNRFRGLGIGEYLCRAVIKTAFDEGASILSLLVSTNNSTAQMLYQKLGFLIVTDEQILSGLKVVNDPVCPHFLMQKCLR